MYEGARIYRVVQNCTHPARKYWSVVVLCGDINFVCLDPFSRGILTVLREIKNVRFAFGSKSNIILGGCFGKQPDSRVSLVNSHFLFSFFDFNTKSENRRNLRCVRNDFTSILLILEWPRPTGRFGETRRGDPIKGVTKTAIFLRSSSCTQLYFFCVFFAFPLLKLTVLRDISVLKNAHFLGTKTAPYWAVMWIILVVLTNDAEFQAKMRLKCIYLTALKYMTQNSNQKPQENADTCVK